MTKTVPVQSDRICAQRLPLTPWRPAAARYLCLWGRLRGWLVWRGDADIRTAGHCTHFANHTELCTAEEVETLGDAHLHQMLCGNLRRPALHPSTQDDVQGRALPESLRAPTLPGDSKRFQKRDDRLICAGRKEMCVRFVPGGERDASDLYREGRVEGGGAGERGGEAGTGRGTRSRCAQRFWFRSDAASKRLYACERKRRTANEKGGESVCPWGPPETPAGRGATAPRAPCAPAAGARRYGEREMRVQFVRGGGRCASELCREGGGGGRPPQWSVTVSTGEETRRVRLVRSAGGGAPPAYS